MYELMFVHDAAKIGKQTRKRLTKNENRLTISEIVSRFSLFVYNFPVFPASEAQSLAFRSVMSSINLFLRKTCGIDQEFTVPALHPAIVVFLCIFVGLIAANVQVNIVEHPVLFCYAVRIGI